MRLGLDACTTLGFFQAKPLLALARFLFLRRAPNAIFLFALGPLRLFPGLALGVLFCAPLGIGTSLGLGPPEGPLRRARYFTIRRRGRTESAPNAKRTALKPKGPMLCMPLRCAEKAAPQIAAVRRRRPSALSALLGILMWPEDYPAPGRKGKPRPYPKRRALALGLRRG